MRLPPKSVGRKLKAEASGVNPRRLKRPVKPGIEASEL
jgi:hypothetical protein